MSVVGFNMLKRYTNNLDIISISYQSLSTISQLYKNSEAISDEFNRNWMIKVFFHQFNL